MADVPRLEIALDTPNGPAVLRLNVHVVTLDGEPLTDEERDLAAVTVACHRRGWRLDFLNGEEWEVYKPDVGKYGQSCVGDTPAEAYKSALEAEK